MTELCTIPTVISPDIEDTSWNVAVAETTGSVERHEIRDIFGINEYSYGRSSPSIVHDGSVVYQVRSVGDVYNGSWGLDDSYGNHFSFSPDLVYYYDYAYCIDKRGAVYDNDQYVAETSYGIFQK